ncbi:GNAT family N-acetyltransferase [Oculatella sp. FACHB-28]|uniref:GNAT family N-acetyltransferase n=1 Tax=Oculatella sp. FACHB-28 TaxID=2692845 RepID=UPI0016856D67|nr:GNAT family N-acetyltransferase [Oculatella sp. FACHB-28]MBD2059254.1 GNAT family N-acetyltransferase [Oculatella sp. FACHB-28]
MPTVQTYTSEYCDQVIDLIRRVQQDEFAAPIKIENQPDLLKIPQFYQVKKGNFWIATEQERVVGTIALIDIGNSQAAIRKMFVDQNYRGKHIGVGQQLLNTLLDWAEIHSISELYLGTIEVFKAAHRFYEKNGFLQINQAELPSTFPVMQADTRFYKYVLSTLNG